MRFIKNKAAGLGTRAAKEYYKRLNGKRFIRTLATGNFEFRRATVKVSIVRLAIWGLLPAGFAQWLINFLGLRGA